MEIPVFASIKYINDDGFLTPEMQIYHDQLNQALQNGLSDNGWQLPLISDANLTKLVAMTPAPRDGTMWYETTNNVVVVMINGSLRKLDNSAYP